MNLSGLQVFRNAVVLGLAAAAGCAVGPDFHSTPSTAPPAWNSPVQQGLTDTASPPESWWSSFNDTELDRLIERAVRSNLDLQIAEARVRQARAIRGRSAADFAPAVAVSASAARSKQSQNQPFLGALPLPPNFPFEYSVYQAGFDASWEIDLFGGKRRALEAATADWQAATEALKDAMVTMSAEVARNYVELRGAQRRLGIARRNLDLQREELDLMRARLQAGMATDLDVTRTAALVADVSAAIPPLETAQRAAMYALAVLLGRQPGELVGELSAAVDVPAAPPEVPIGLPSDLLRRRADVRRAERELAAETARIGVAESAWFPKISLTGDAGAESVSVGNWFAPTSRFWSIGPSVQWDALDFGRVRAQVRAQTAVQEAALGAFQKAVLVSLQEAENAIVAYAQERNRDRALADAVADDRRSLDLAESLYKYGSVNFLDVLDARRSLYASEDQLALSDQTVSIDVVALYKALGGGWEALPQAPSSAPATAPAP